MDQHYLKTDIFRLILNTQPCLTELMYGYRFSDNLSHILFVADKAVKMLRDIFQTPLQAIG